MRNKFKILYVSAEVFPFTKTSDLADIAGALPKYLKALGHDIRVMMPNYRTINERKYVLRDVIRLQGLRVQLGKEEWSANGKSAFIPDSKVQVYFLDNKELFDRNGLYADAETGVEFKDNAERYMFFSMACLETLKLLHWQPDIIHCNDWQTACIPLLLKSVYRDDPFFKGTKTLLSVHDFSRQGEFESADLREKGVLDHFDGLTETNGHINFLRLGLEYADMVSTVSETYAETVQTKAELAGQVDHILKRKSSQFVGITSGIDDHVWNPEKDRLIETNYNKNDPTGKAENRRALLERMGLTAADNVPVLSFISPLREEKGIDVVLAIIEQILALDVRLLIAGGGNPEYEKQLTAVRKKHASKLALEFAPNDDLRHLVVAGSDMLLMPSRVEPAGLVQLYGLTYGTIPILTRAAGGSAQIQPFDSKTKSGNSFVADKLTPNALLKEVKTALACFQDKELWQKLVVNAMKQDFSWKGLAPKYVKLYQRLVSGKNNKK